MAQANVEVKVQSQDLDKLRGKLVELQKGLKIQYDINGKPIDVVIDKTLNLQKQLRLLTSELRKTKEGTAEFQLLSSKIGDTEDALARSNAKSRDLLASLQLIPGPVGQFASQLNGVIGTLKLFSGFSFKDLKFQLKELNNDISDIVGNIFNLSGAAKESAGELGDTAASLANTGAEELNTSATLENVAAQQASQVEKGKDVIATQADRTATLQNTLATLEDSIARSVNTREIIRNEVARLNAAAAAGSSTAATALNTKAEELNNIVQRISTLQQQKKTVQTELSTIATNQNTVSTEANAVATTTATAATRGFGATLKAVLSSTLFWVVAIGTVIYALYKWIKSTAELTREQKAANDLNQKIVENYGEQIVKLETLNKRVKEGGLTQRQKNEAVNDYNKTLGDTLGKVKSYAELEKKLIENGPIYVKYLQLKAKAESAYQLSVERGKQLLQDELKNSVEYANAFDIWAEGGFLGFIYDTSNQAGQKKKEKFLQGLRQDQNTFLEIFKTTQAEADQLAEQLKIPVPEVKTDGGKDPKKVENDNAKILELQKKFNNEIQQLREGDERKRQELQIRQSAQSEIDEINKLKLTKDKEGERAKLIQQVKDKEGLQLKELDEKYKKEELKRQKEFNRKLEDIEIASIEDKRKREDKEREVEQKRALEDLEEDVEFAKLSEEKKEEARQNIRNKYASMNTAVQKERRKEDKDKRLEELDDELKFLQIRQEAIREGTKAFFDSQREILNLAEQREIEAAEGKEKEITAIKEKYSKLRKDLDKQEKLSTLQAIGQTIDAVANLTAAIASSYDEEAKTSKDAFEKRKKLQIATATMSAASGIIQILTQPSTLPSPFDWIVKGINAAALAVTTAVQISNIKKTEFEGGGSTASGTVRGMARGGYIDGPRHAQGGVLIEAEGGEAVMTRGAVSMFGPLLSMMNQAGGGTNFNQNMMFTANDAPATSGSDQAPVVVKTYVVSNELTTEQEKQARLKQLSTL